MASGICDCVTCRCCVRYILVNLFVFDVVIPIVAACVGGVVLGCNDVVLKFVGETLVVTVILAVLCSRGQELVATRGPWN